MESGAIKLVRVDKGLLRRQPDEVPVRHVHSLTTTETDSRFGRLDCFFRGAVVGKRVGVLATGKVVCDPITFNLLRVENGVSAEDEELFFVLLALLVDDSLHNGLVKHNLRSPLAGLDAGRTRFHAKTSTFPLS